jgi:chemotaxis regulatin CheY-phosphate phosphatase CheZ
VKVGEMPGEPERQDIVVDLDIADREQAVIAEAFPRARSRVDVVDDMTQFNARATQTVEVLYAIADRQGGFSEKRGSMRSPRCSVS